MSWFTNPVNLFSTRKSKSKEELEEEIRSLNDELGSVQRMFRTTSNDDKIEQLRNEESTLYSKLLSANYNLDELKRTEKYAYDKKYPRKLNRLKSLSEEETDNNDSNANETTSSSWFEWRKGGKKKHSKTKRAAKKTNKKTSFRSTKKHSKTKRR